MSPTKACACLGGSAPTRLGEAELRRQLGRGRDHERAGQRLGEARSGELGVVAAGRGDVLLGLGRLGADPGLLDGGHGRQVGLDQERGVPADRDRRGVLAASGSPRSCRRPAACRARRPRWRAARRSGRGPAPWSGRSSPSRVLTTVVVSPPVRATPTTWVVTGSVQSRSTSSVASSPTPTTRCVDSSWTRGLAQPAYQSSVVLYVRSPAASSAEASADCPAVSGSGPALAVRCPWRASAPCR